MDFLTILCTLILPPILAFFGVLLGAVITLRYFKNLSRSKPIKPPHATYNNKVGNRK